MIKWQYILIMMVWFGFGGCENISEDSNDDAVVLAMNRLPENEAGDVVRNAIKYIGGWDIWNEKKNFSFYKNITHIDSAGNVEKHQRQLHQYQLKPHFKAKMSWEDNGNKYVIINNGSESKKYENGKEMTDDKSKNQAWNSSFGSHYVISMPFKLTDPGVILTYEGIDSTTLNRRVHSLKVEYEKGAGSSGGYHNWWYYFDENTYDMVANYLDYGEGHSLTTYETFTKAGGIRLHKKRFSHIADAEKNMVQKRTIYENEEMQFDKDFKEDLFDLK